MLDPNHLHPPPSSPTNSSISSSDLDTQSSCSFFHDRSTTLGTLMGVTSSSTIFRAPSQHRQSGNAATAANVDNNGRINRRRLTTMLTGRRRQRRWWRLCRDEDSILVNSDVVGFIGDTYELGFEGIVGAQTGNRQLLFADGRVMPPAQLVDEPSDSTGGVLCRFSTSLTRICNRTGE